jgi:hypothetical protein
LSEELTHRNEHTVTNMLGGKCEQTEVSQTKGPTVDVGAIRGEDDELTNKNEHTVNTVQILRLRNGHTVDVGATRSELDVLSCKDEHTVNLLKETNVRYDWCEKKSFLEETPILTNPSENNHTVIKQERKNIL